MNESLSSRRAFLKTTAVAAGTALATGAVSHVHAAGSDTIKVGLIGCGGRGRGAADDCTKSAPNVKLVAMGDVFEDRLKDARTKLKGILNDRFDVKDDKCFSGLDAYKQVIDSGVDLVCLCTPPGFRPPMLEYAVQKNKHIFTEKPVAVDGPGARKCLEIYEEANKKKLCIVAGTQRRHQTGYLETMKRIHDGAIGEITSGRCYWVQGPIWVYKREEKWTDLEYQLRNWYYYVWLCGDHIVEQHVHNLDVINWATQSHPVRAFGLGGRSERTGPEFGHIFDHFAIDYEYPSGMHLTSMSRQNSNRNLRSNTTEHVTGTKGACQFDRYNIRPYKGLGEAWKFGGKDNAPYVQEHTDLIEHIRTGKHINELKTVTEGTMTAILGRMAAYTGDVVEWDQALNSQENTMPSKLAWDMSLPTPSVAIPGRTKLT
ncbi:MAG: Gfo/Idh/MocA family oxidoreductase [Gemmataceae bacterium]|nr:Gfo/Idh/MocA family oxidoreductase [Gemmataceae bacterium]